MLFDGWNNLIHTLVMGSLTYLVLVLLLRISGKRTLSKWNAFDLVVTIAFGSMLASSVLSKDTALAQVVVGFALLIVLQLIITWLSVRSPLFQSWIKAKPTLLLHRGRLLEEAMRRCRVPKSEILSSLRANGIGNLEEVEAVVLETDGSFSVIKQSSEGPTSTLADVTHANQQTRPT